MSEYSCNYTELEGLYEIHEELGSGGFGKVKLATHILTGCHVAIKIIDKKAIGEDLPRVQTEMDALRNLAHQNICRLYHFIENSEKFFIIMEYCSGGEMFDYIVRKERLEESEARHFFRQLVQAMTYVHFKGYAHRDLKPENLLITEDLQLKLIDFGLCAKPGDLTNPLNTCCGSPAYAAPELIQGRDYKGDKADVWSMGVLLYALLCGALPFEDDNMQNLYRKITRGNYCEPPYLSVHSRLLLSQMLTVNPDHRIPVRDLLSHVWLNHDYHLPIKWRSIYDLDRNIVDEEVTQELAYHHQTSIEEMKNLIREYRYDYLTASYLLLVEKKRKRQFIHLPPPRNRKGEPNMIGSPTIHASLEQNLDKSGMHDSDDSATSSGGDLSKEVRFARPVSPLNHKKSYANAMMNMGTLTIGGSCSRSSGRSRDGDGSISASSTPVRHKTVARPINSLGFDPVLTDKENYHKGAASLRVRGPVKVTDNGGTRPASIYSTPQRNPVKGLFSPNNQCRQRRKPRSKAMSTNDNARAEKGETGFRAVSSDRARSGSPTSIKSGGGTTSEGRTPRSATKTPKIRQRICGSVERNVDRVITLLTPRKKQLGSQTLKVIKDPAMLPAVNISLTEHTDADFVKAELVRVFAQQNYVYEVNGWRISGERRDKDADGKMCELRVELEVVWVDKHGKVGVRRKRLKGDAFLYKRVCEKILELAKIS